MSSVVKYSLNAVLVLILLLLFGSSAVWNGASNTLERELGRFVGAPRDVAMASTDVPAPVARFLERSMLAGQQRIRTARLEQTGERSVRFHLKRVNSAFATTALGRVFIAPKDGPGPVMQDPEHPYVTNDEFRVSGRQPTERRLSSGRSQLTMSGTKLVRRMARPRTGSGSMSSLYL